MLQKAKQYDQAEYQPKRRIGQKSVDPYSCLIKEVQTRMHRGRYDTPVIQPHKYHSKDILPPTAMKESPIASAAPKWLHTIYDPNAASKMGERPRRSYFSSMCWTPEGRRLITGNSRGEFTLWHGTSLASEMRTTGHADSKVTSMVWCEGPDFMISSDDRGQIKYWARNMSFFKEFNATPNSSRIREIATSPSGAKFACCSEDGIVRLWDTKTSRKDAELQGHGGDVKTCHWHPSKNLFASGSQDKKIILWDPRSQDRMSSLLGHTASVTRVRWSSHDYWLLTCSEDSTIKLFDIRMLSELQTFTGHRKEVNSISWHPIHSSMFASVGRDGQLSYWIVGQGKQPPTDSSSDQNFSKAVSTVYKAHGEGYRDPNSINDLAWHPMGHVLVTASYECKFWTHNKPGTTEEVRGAEVSMYGAYDNYHRDDGFAKRRWNIWNSPDGAADGGAGGKGGKFGKRDEREEDGGDERGGKKGEREERGPRRKGGLDDRRGGDAEFDGEGGARDRDERPDFRGKGKKDRDRDERGKGWKGGDKRGIRDREYARDYDADRTGDQGWEDEDTRPRKGWGKGRDKGGARDAARTDTHMDKEDDSMRGNGAWDDKQQNAKESADYDGAWGSKPEWADADMHDASAAPPPLPRDAPPGKGAGKGSKGAPERASRRAPRYYEGRDEDEKPDYHDAPALGGLEPPLPPMPNAPLPPMPGFPPMPDGSIPDFAQFVCCPYPRVLAGREKKKRRRSKT
ncbi:Flowering time control protein FY [Diplonema papillatum]|nr:Flowering time control protein FY [Diplonema papillatum]